MILIIDSGSTKTEWSVVSNNLILKTFRSGGINPYFHDVDYIYNNNVKEVKDNINAGEVKHIFFYGAGCSSEAKCSIVYSGLKKIFVNADIEVHHDLLGAARALCGHNEGIAGILGTGSNSCKYDGKLITENVRSLGYLFGDEGGGVHIGKQFITDFLRGRLPIDLQKDFDATYKLTVELVLDNVYNKPNPNRFLASFSMFVSKHISNEYCYTLVYNCLDLYFKEQITRYTNYQNYQLNCLGSVAYNFKNILEVVAKAYNVRLGKIISNPNQDLIAYHLLNKN